MNRPQQEIVELIQADIDAEISASDAKKLQEYLDKDPQARQWHEDYRQMVTSLEAMPELSPPADLAARSMAAVRLAERENVTRAPLSIFSGWLEFPMLRYGLAFLVGAIFASAISQLRLADPTYETVANLSGTMSPNHQFQPVHTIALAQEVLQGQVQLSRNDQLLRLHFDLRQGLPKIGSILVFARTHEGA